MCILIDVCKDGKYSIKISFDKQGSLNLIKNLTNALINKYSDIEAIHKTTQKSIKICFKKNNNINNIIFSKQNLIIELDSDEIEYAIERFKESEIQKIFYPSELCEGILKNKNVTIYAQYIENF